MRLHDKAGILAEFARRLENDAVTERDAALAEIGKITWLRLADMVGGMSQLTTHVLDTMRGTGAACMRVEVSAPDGRVSGCTLDASGRATLLTNLTPGAYEIRFFAGDYLGAESFYDVIPVRCLIAAEQTHYHVPLILSAYGYSTYRGG